MMFNESSLSTEKFEIQWNEICNKPFLRHPQQLSKEPKIESENYANFFKI